MQNNTSFPSLVKQAFLLSVRNPFFLVALCLPSAFGELTFEYFFKPSGTPDLKFAIALILGLAFFSFFELLSSAAFFIWTRAMEKQTPIRSPLAVLTETLQKTRLWYPAGLAALALIVVGSALIIPGIYFMTVFSFVTPVAIEHPTLSAFASLSVSKRFFHRRFVSLFIPVCLLVLFEVILSFGLPELVSRGYFGSLESYATLTDIFMKILITAYQGWVSIFISLLFLNLRRNT